MKKIALLLAILLVLSISTATGESLLGVVRTSGAPFKIDNERLNVAKKAFSDKYPNVDIEFDTRDVTQQSNNPIDKDILILYDAELKFDTLLPLNDFPDLLSIANNFAPYSKYLSHNDKYYALPYKAWLTFAVIESEDAYTALKVDKNITWENLFNLAPSLIEYNRENNSNIKLFRDTMFMPTFLSQYCFEDEKSPNPDSKNKLSKIIEQWQIINNQGLISTSINEPALISIVAFEINHLTDIKNITLPPRYSEHGVSSQILIDMFAINANSKKINEAVDFLSLYFSKDAIKASQHFADNGVYPSNKIENSGYKALNEYHLNLWNNAIQSSYTAISPRITKIAKVWKSFVINEISLDDCVNAIIEK